MKTKDLIAQLQKLVDEHEPHEWIMGEHEIVIDMFKRKEGGGFNYAGFSPDIKIELTDDGVYHIFNAFVDR